MTKNKNLDKTITSFEDSNDVNMSDLMKSYDESTSVDIGKEFEGTIIEENSDSFMVDLGTKSEGMIPKEEFEESAIPPELKVGAKLKVKVISTYGQTILSYRKIIEEKKWSLLREIFEKNKRVKAVILKTIKGGFSVDVCGVNAFLPIAQVDMHFVKETEQYIGKSYEFVITKFDARKKNVVVSRRKIIEDEINTARASALESITEGQILDGTVSRITKFEAFINLGGVDGLLHIGELAWYRVKKIEDLLHIGQVIRVQVLKVDKAGEKISLSMKNLSPHPWDSASERLPLGLITKGTVTSITSYGVFVEFEPGVEGLLHVSEYAWSDSGAALKRDVKKGQEIEVKIIGVDKENKKISLSVKRILTNPWDEAFRHYAPGTVVKGVVQNFESFGAFVKLPEGIEGLIRISNFSWTKKIAHPEAVIKKGDEVEVVVLGVHPENERISLSLKHMQPNPYDKYKVGSIVKGKVVRTSDFGAFIEIEAGIEALVKNNRASFVETGSDRYVLKEGEEVEAKVTRVDIRNRKIEASVKKLEADREKELIKQYANQDSKYTLGEMLFEE
ncbi:30S ribosomal protein S1 [Endomicrobiia bacterium]|nr:30S ribosomal protein S1 [Endomicrobiia bacterium]